MSNPKGARRESEHLQAEILTAIKEERWGDLTPFAGQSAELIHEILPASEIIRRIMSDAEERLKTAAHLLNHGHCHVNA